MTTKIKFELEIPLHISSNMLYSCIATPSGLEKWFADKVNSRGKIISFFWDDSEEEAKIVSKKSGERIKYKWLESEGDESFFEFKIQIDPLTNDTSLLITDFAEDEDSIEEAKQLWLNQIDNLKSTVGA